MPIRRFTAQNFRCLESIELEADPEYNLIYGRNASGKTSVLEAIAYLGRGKSFRGASTTDLVIRTGRRSFCFSVRWMRASVPAKVGVRNSHDGLETRVDGESDGGAAASSRGAALANSLTLMFMSWWPALRTSAGATWIGLRSTWNMAIWTTGGDFVEP